MRKIDHFNFLTELLKINRSRNHIFFPKLTTVQSTPAPPPFPTKNLKYIKKASFFIFLSNKVLVKTWSGRSIYAI